MIITKGGRCLFPTLSFIPSLLKANTLYSFAIDIVPDTLPSPRLRFKNNSWIDCTPAVDKIYNPDVLADDDSFSNVTKIGRPFLHPHSPQKGINHCV